MISQTKLFDEIRNFLVLFSVLGLWPTWTNSKFRGLFIFSLISNVTYIFGIFSSVFYYNAEFSYHTLSAIVQFLFLAGILMTHFTVIVEAFINRNAQMHLIEKISYADQLLYSKFQLNISYDNEKNTIFIRLASVMFTFMVLRTIFTFDLYYSYGINTFPYRLILSAWIIQLRTIQVLFFVYLLRIRLQFVSDQLNEMLIPSEFCGKRKTQVKFFHDTTNIFVLDMSFAKRSLYDRLVNLKQIYGELHEICELINVTFGWSLLTIIVQSLIDLISCFYWFYLALQESIHSLAIVCLFDLLPIIVLVVSMAYICSSCSCCVSRFSSYCAMNVCKIKLISIFEFVFVKTRFLGSDLHRIMQNSNNEDLNDLIREFSFQILQEPISISANDFFGIEYQLLSSVRMRC